MEVNFKNKQSIALIFLISVVLFVLMSPRLLNKITQESIKHQSFNIEKLSSIISISGDVLFDEASSHTTLSEFSGRTHSLIGSWTLNSVSRYNFASYGFSIASSTNQQVALKFTPWIDYNVLINGEIIASSFQDNQFNQKYRPGQPTVVVFDIQEGSNEIIIQINNELRYISGISSEVFIGPASLVMNYAQLEIIFDIIYFASFLITGLFLIIQAILIRGNNRFRWLYVLIALTLIVFAFNIAGYKEKIIYFIFPNLDTISLFKLSDIVRSLHFVLTMGLLFILKYKIFHWSSRVLLLIFVLGYFLMVLVLPMQLVQSITMTYYTMLTIIILPIGIQVLYSIKQSPQDNELLYSEFSLVIMLILSGLYGVGLLLYGLGIWWALLIAYWILLLKIMALITFFVNNQLQALNLSQQSLEAMKTMNMMKSSFYEHTSLQLQQPLSHLSQLSEYLLDDESLTKHHQTLHHVHVLTQNMRRHVQDMMEYEQVKETNSLISRTQISLDTFMTYVFNYHHDVLSEHNITVELNMPHTSIHGLGDSVHLFNFFHQLIKYALRSQVDLIKVGVDLHARVNLNLQSSSSNQMFDQLSNIFLTTAPLKDLEDYSLRLQFMHLELMNIHFVLNQTYPQQCELFFNFELSEIKDNQLNLSKKLELSRTLILLSPFTEMAFNLTAVFHAFNINLAHIFNPDEIALIQTKIDGILVDLDHYNSSSIMTILKESLNIMDIPIYGLTQDIENQDVSSLLEIGYVEVLRQPLSINEFIHRFNTYEKLKNTMHDLLNQEMRFLQSQIKPHFLFNALSTIIAMCSFDPPKASQLLENLSDYLRYGLDFNRHDHLISCQQELEMIQAYVNIEQARFHERCKFETNIDSRALNFPIVPFLIQPLVENAIKHGILSKEEGGKVVLSLSVINDVLHVSVSDNGIGLSDSFINSLHEHQKLPGIGLSNVMRQLKLVYQTSLIIENQNPGACFSFAIERKLTV
jgi:two-component system, sensor histidine kinase ChiS